MSKRKTKEEFIKEVMQKNPKYDYSKVYYVNNYTKVTVICPEHGEFCITPQHLLQGKGCAQCGRISAKNKLKDSKQKFIEKARKIHGDKYNYSKFDYENAHVKSIIICPIHGEFLQNANNHLQGKGCPKCSSEKQKVGTKEFIERASKIHNNFYDYSLVKYNRTDEKIKIKCPIHGEFEQTPNSHLRGRGCPKCNQSKGEKLVESILNKYKIPYLQQHRVHDVDRSYIIDFYVKHNNQEYFIEYNGIQHYIPVEQFGGELIFNKQKERDSNLRDYCKNNDIKLLEISYEEKDVENIIKNYFDL